MGLSFLTPAFFLGLAALAVPVFIHLTHREKREIVEFPSLMFLNKIPYRSVRRQKIRQWLLFLLRCIALMLLVVAFTRPFWERSSRAASSASGARELVILLDRSYSMGYADRWQRAREAALGVQRSLQPEDRATLVTFAEHAEAVNEPSGDGAALAAALDGVGLSSETTRYGPALKLAKKILEDSKLRRREVVLVTDFQKVGWEGSEQVELPEGTELTLVDLSDPTTSNVALTSVVLQGEVVAGRERVIASARLTNKGKEPLEGIDVALELAARQVQVKRVSLAADGSTRVTFDPFTLPEGVTRGRIRIEDDRLTRDNSYYFVMWPGQSLSVLIVEGSRHGRQSLYLRRALSIGERPSFHVEVKPMARLGAEDLESPSFVVMNDTPSPGERLGRRLKRFVEDGGGLLVVLGEGSGRTGWKGPAAEILPGNWVETVDRSADWGGTLAFIDYGHEVFELFGAPHSGDFSTAKFFRYRPLRLSPEARVLARFDDATVCLAERKVGKGKVFVWTSTLDTFWNDLAIQPVFLPFVHQIARYASSYAEAEHWHMVGDVLNLTRLLEVVSSSVELPTGVKELGSEELVALAPSGERTVVSPEQGRYLLTLREQGFYKLRLPGSDPSSLVSFAVNVDVRESDLSALDPEELQAAVSFRGQSRAATVPAEWPPEEQERSQGVWWLLLVGAALVLAAETVLSNRLSRLAR